MSACKQCGAPVLWRKDGGRWQCYDPDGTTVHWARCSQLRFERIKREGEHFERSTSDETIEGYAFRDREGWAREQLVRIDTKPKRAPAKLGKAIKSCRQCVPAWEQCPNNCPAEFRA